MARVTPFRFDPGDFPARKFHPLSKFLSMLLLSLGAYAAGVALIALFAAVAISCAAASGIFSRGITRGIARLCADGKFLATIGLFVGFFRVFDFGSTPFFRPSELAGTAEYLARIAVVFVLAEAFFKSTANGELAATATGFARAALRRDDIDPGLYLGLAVGFIPSCFDRYARTKEAALARGYGSLRDGGKGVGIRATFAILEAFIADSMRSALRTAGALEIRGYSPERPHEPIPFRLRDAALTSFSAASLALALMA